MAVENVFAIEGRGTVASGKIDQGQVRVGDSVEIVGRGDEVRSVVVTQVESFREVLEVGLAGQNVGLLLRGVRRDEIGRGQVLAAPGTLVPRREIEAEVYVLSGEEGGRHTPFVAGYTPQFYFGTTDVPGTVNLLGDVDMALPGDGVNLSVRLGKPIACEVGSQFAIREGNKTVGSGIVTKVIG